MIERLHSICVGVVYGEFHPLAKYQREIESESAGESTAREVLQVITGMGCPAFLIPLGVDLLCFLSWIKDLRVDLIVNLCESCRGIPQLEANVAALFELLDLPFTGSPAKTLALCQDKNSTKAVLASYGLETPKGRLVETLDEGLDIGFPVIAKPNCEDASLGIDRDAVSYDSDSLKRKVRRIHDTYRHPVLVEEYIPGREFSVAVLDIDGPRALPVSEILFGEDAGMAVNICSYEAKWLEDHALYRATPPLCPAEIPDSLRDTLQQKAVAAFKALECRDYARVDFRMSPDGTVYILEVNPNPDISRAAGFARALNAAGIPYSKFWLKMIDKALQRRHGDDQRCVHLRFPRSEKDPEEKRSFYAGGDRGRRRTDGYLQQPSRSK